MQGKGREKKSPHPADPGAEFTNTLNEVSGPEQQINLNKPNYNSQNKTTLPIGKHK
jgi:hypothetical protein